MRDRAAKSFRKAAVDKDEVTGPVHSGPVLPSAVETFAQKTIEALRSSDFAPSEMGLTSRES